MKPQNWIIWILLPAVLLISACQGAAPQEATQSYPAPTAPAEMPNPASENCISQGGALEFQERGDGGQYGICYFEDNRQCEEWALLRGECPVGGLKITGYITPAAQYCAITGGAYAITSRSNTETEQGTCTLVDGTICDVWDYYNGACSAGAPAAPAGSAELAIQPLSMEVCDGQAQAMAHFLDVYEVTQSEAPLDDPVTGASGVGCLATVTGTGEQFGSPDIVIATLGSMLEDQGWTEDPLLASGGPTGAGAGYRKGSQISLVAATWQPDAAVSCPSDQPISACQVKPAQQIYTITLNTGEEAPVK